MQSQDVFENQNSKGSHRCCGQSPPPMLPSDSNISNHGNMVLGVAGKPTPTPVCGVGKPISLCGVAIALWP